MDGSEQFSGSGGKRVLSLPSNTIGFQAVIALQGRVVSQYSADVFYYKVPEPSPSDGAEIAACARSLGARFRSFSRTPLSAAAARSSSATGGAAAARRGSRPREASASRRRIIISEIPGNYAQDLAQFKFRYE